MEFDSGGTRGAGCVLPDNETYPHDDVWGKNPLQLAETINRASFRTRGRFDERTLGIRRSAPGEPPSSAMSANNPIIYPTRSEHIAKACHARMLQSDRSPTATSEFVTVSESAYSLAKRMDFSHTEKYALFCLNLSPTRILIIEDNSDDKDLLLRQLNKAGLGAQVRVVDDGENALAFLHSAIDQVVAVFLDLHLPRLSGLALLERVRSDDRFEFLPVIIMTSSNDPLDLQECARLGVAGFVKKPITYASFSKAIADTFHRPLSHRSATGPLR